MSDTADDHDEEDKRANDPRAALSTSASVGTDAAVDGGCCWSCENCCFSSCCLELSRLPRSSAASCWSSILSNCSSRCRRGVAEAKLLMAGRTTGGRSLIPLCQHSTRCSASTGNYSNTDSINSGSTTSADTRSLSARQRLSALRNRGVPFVHCSAHVDLSTELQLAAVGAIMADGRLVAVERNEDVCRRFPPSQSPVVS